MEETGKFYSYETLQTLIDYGNIQFKNLCRVLKYLSHNNTCKFEDWVPIDYLPKTKNNLHYIQEQVNCSCNHDIVHCFTVKNKFNNNSIIVGSSCINKFFDDEANEIKNRLVDEYKGKKKCPECKKTVSKQVVEKYKHEENIYHIKCYPGKDYIDDLLELNAEEPEPPSYETVVPVDPVYQTVVPVAPVYQTVVPVAPVYQKVVPIAPIFRINPITTIVKIGKFKGKPLSDLLKDVNYCDWIKSVEEPSGKLKEIQEYLLSAQSV
jgi:hypothetical protein